MSELELWTIRQRRRLTAEKRREFLRWRRDFRKMAVASNQVAK